MWENCPKVKVFRMVRQQTDQGRPLVKEPGLLAKGKRLNRIRKTTDCVYRRIGKVNDRFITEYIDREKENYYVFGFSTGVGTGAFAKRPHCVTIWFWEKCSFLKGISGIYAATGRSVSIHSTGVSLVVQNYKATLVMMEEIGVVF